MTSPTDPHLPLPVFGHPTFTVTLDSLRITDTRAQHEDTDFVALTVLLKSATDPGTPQTVSKRSATSTTAITSSAWPSQTSPSIQPRH